MDFWQFVERQASITVAGFASDGRVVIYIDGVRYEYVTDSMYHARWRRMARYQPGRVLNEIKKLVKAGQATMTKG